MMAQAEPAAEEKEAGFDANQAAEKVHFLSPGYHEHIANNSWPNKRTTYYSQNSEPWDPESLPKCESGSSPDPVDGKLTFDQGRIDVVKYPHVGATCKAQVMA